MTKHQSCRECNSDFDGPDSNIGSNLCKSCDEELHGECQAAIERLEDKVAWLRSEFDRLTIEIHGLQAENKGLEADRNRYERRFGDAQSKLREWQEFTGFSSPSNAGEKIERLQEEIDRLEIVDGYERAFRNVALNAGVDGLATMDLQEEELISMVMPDQRTEEHCSICDSPTGRAGAADDSIFWLDGAIGPLCVECHDKLQDEVLDNLGMTREPAAEIERLKADNARLTVRNKWLQAEVERLHSNVESVDTSYGSLASENVGLKADNEQKATLNAGLLADIDRLEAENKRMRDAAAAVVEDLEAVGFVNRPSVIEALRLAVGLPEPDQKSGA